MLSILSVWFVIESFNSLEKSIYYMQKGSIRESSNQLKSSQQKLQAGESLYAFISPILNIFLPAQNEKNHNLLAFNHHSQSTIQSLLQTYLLGEKIYFSIGNQEQDINFEEISIALKTNLQLSFENLSQIELILSKGNLPRYAIIEISKSLEYGKIKDIQNQISYLTKFVDVVPPSLSGELGKNIVVAFQNTHESRSTGGVIEAVLHLSLDKGRVVSKKIYLGSEIDSMAGQNAEPPPLVRDMTGSTDWKVRDIGYNPDFPQTAINLSWIIENKLKISPDAIVFVDDQILTEFIKRSQDISVKGEKITPEKFQATLSNGEGSGVVLPIIQLLTDEITSHKTNFFDLCQIIVGSIKESQLLYWTRDSVVEKSILNQSYTGSVREHDCHPGVQSARLCLSQTAHLSISNYSAIPLNSYLKHQITHQVFLETNKIKHTYIVDYDYTKNTPLLNRELAEIYQMYIPQGSIITSMVMDGQPISLSNISAKSEVGLDRYQFPVSTSLNSKHKIIINFEYPLIEQVKLPIAYSFTEIRQPGTSYDGVTLEINHPLSIRPSVVTSEITTKSGKIIYQFPHKTATFGVHFVPNQI
jgi:hypothetical protein